MAKHEISRCINLAHTGEPLIIDGSVEKKLSAVPDACVQTTVTSPPYYRQKDYDSKDQLGWEPTVGDYVTKMTWIFQELWRVTNATGSCFFVIGDTYANKTLQLVPQRLAIAACNVGWTIRNDLIWAKTDAAPDGAADRWRFSHEHVLFMTKAARGYKFNADEIRVPYSPVTLRRWANGQQYGGDKSRKEAGPKGPAIQARQDLHAPCQGDDPARCGGMRDRPLPPRPLRDVSARADRAIRPGDNGPKRSGLRSICRDGHFRGSRGAEFPAVSGD